MPSKNDLSALKVQSKSTLKATQKIHTIVNAWRKPKPIWEKQSELIGLRFTMQEYDCIKEKAGLVPIATYLKNELFTKTDIFK